MNRQWRAIIAICAMSFTILAASATSPALSTIALSFPDAPATAIASIATLSSLTSMVGTVITGAVAGKYIRFRPLAMIGLAIVAVGGLIPYFSTTITQILIGRAVLGIGTGLTNPSIITLTLSLFDGKDTAKQFGRNGMATNFGAVLFQLAGGWLCNYGWRMPFMTYFAIIPVFFIVLILLPEPERIVTKDGNVKRARFSFRKVMTPHVIFWGVVHALYMAFFYPYVTQMSGIITGEGLGTAMTAAIVLSIQTGSGVLGGYLFYYVCNCFRRNTFTIGFGLCAVGYLILIFAGNVPLIAAGSIIFGIGYGILAPAINYYLGKKLVPEYRASCVSAESLFSHLGSFGSPFVIAFLESVVGLTMNRSAFVYCFVFFCIASLGFGISGLLRKGE